MQYLSLTDFFQITKPIDTFFVITKETSMKIFKIRCNELDKSFVAILRRFFFFKP